MFNTSALSSVDLAIAKSMDTTRLSCMLVTSESQLWALEGKCYS